MKELYFDEVEVGAEGISPPFTVTAAHIDTYADLTGDHTPVHTDEAYARTTPFGTRVAHGLLGLALGLCTGALDCWLLALVLWFLVSVTAGGLDWLNTAVLQRSVGYSFFGAFNPFLVHY